MATENRPIGGGKQLSAFDLDEQAAIRLVADRLLSTDYDPISGLKWTDMADELDLGRDRAAVARFQRFITRRDTRYAIFETMLEVDRDRSQLGEFNRLFVQGAAKIDGASDLRGNW